MQNKLLMVYCIIMMIGVVLFMNYQIDKADKVYEQCLEDGKAEYECDTHAYGHFGK